MGIDINFASLEHRSNCTVPLERQSSDDMARTDLPQQKAELKVVSLKSLNWFHILHSRRKTEGERGGGGSRDGKKGYGERRLHPQAADVMIIWSNRFSKLIR